MKKNGFHQYVFYIGFTNMLAGFIKNEKLIS